jgi:hypothetical protein
MDIDATSLIVSMIIGSVGLVAFIYGKRQSRMPQMLVGLVMMIYQYFVPNVFLMAGIGVALTAGLWLAVRLGW